MRNYFFHVLRTWRWRLCNWSQAWWVLCRMLCHAEHSGISHFEDSIECFYRHSKERYGLLQVTPESSCRKCNRNYRNWQELFFERTLVAFCLLPKLRYRLRSNLWTRECPVWDFRKWLLFVLPNFRQQRTPAKPDGQVYCIHLILFASMYWSKGVQKSKITKLHCHGTRSSSKIFRQSDNFRIMSMHFAERQFAV